MKSIPLFVSGFVLGALATAAVAMLTKGDSPGVAAASQSEARDSAAQAAGDRDAASGERRSAPAPAAKKGDVLVNGHKLTKDQLKQFVERYKVEPLPGNYWYDKKSGLWGNAGQPAAGFLLPDHDLGSLTAGASSGDSEVFLNGRCMPQQEVLAFTLILGQAILPGRYWLDGAGNYGWEGLDVAAGNLYITAQANAARGGGGRSGGGGDNFWNTRFSAGNYNDDNTQGYVSVPGIGPVSYGM